MSNQFCCCFSAWTKKVIKFARAPGSLSGHLLRLCLIVVVVFESLPRCIIGTEKKQLNMAKNKRQKRIVKTTIRGVPYEAGPPREPFPQLKSRQARNYRREVAATEANEELYEHEESVFLLYLKLKNARKAKDKKTEKEVEAQFLNQVARYKSKSQTSSAEQSDIDISDFDVNTADLENNSLLDHVFDDLTTPSIVVANENVPFVDRHGQRFLNTEVYENGTFLNRYDTRGGRNKNASLFNNDTVISTNLTFHGRTSTEQQKLASTPFPKKPTRQSDELTETSSDNSLPIVRTSKDDFADESSVDECSDK